MDLCMRVCRTQHDRMRQAIEGEVVEIAALTSQKAQILAPFRRIADARSNHRSALFALTRPCLTIAVSGDARSKCVGAPLAKSATRCGN